MKCTAKAKSTGSQCRRDAIAGGRVCQVHGGAAPQVKRAAAERLAEARDDALELLKLYIASKDVDAKVALDTVTKLTELTETLEGRVARREGREVNSVSDVDRELAHLADELRSRASGSVPVAEDSTT